MASFKEMQFTPAEFANIAKVDRSQVSVLESQGKLKTIKRRIGNVDRKMIPLEEMQAYFRNLRVGEIGRHGDQPAPMGTGAEAAGPQIPAESPPEVVAAATG